MVAMGCCLLSFSKQGMRKLLHEDAAQPAVICRRAGSNSDLYCVSVARMTAMSRHVSTRSEDGKHFLQCAVTAKLGSL